MASILVASDWAPIRAFDGIAGRGPEALYGGLLPVIRSADFRLVNCECALTAARRPVWKSGSVFKGRPEHAAALAEAPFDAACLANNHVLDYGPAGLRDTLAALRGRGLRTIGAEMDEKEALAPLTFRVKGSPVAIVNFSEGEDLTTAHGGPGVCGWDIERLAGLVRGFKKRGHFVVAVGHAGLEYIPFPPPYVVRAFRALSDAGADAVIGHHPHVPQGVETRNGRLIAYSLGNFAFFQPAELHWRHTGFCVMLHESGGRLTAHEIIPYAVTAAGLRKLDAPGERDFRRKLDAVSRPLASDRSVADAWQAWLAYYGPKGFAGEVAMILDMMKSEPKKGAAMFRNRITTLQHAELWRDALTRFMSDKPAAPRARFTRLIQEWLTRPAASSRPRP